MNSHLYSTCILAAFLVLMAGGCQKSRVGLVFFNLGTNEIWVTKIEGIPEEGVPGRLGPVPNEGQLYEKSTVYFEPIRIGKEIMITWEDGGAEGWPGGNYVNRTPLREMTWTREELGVPATMKSGKLRFTYLGGDKWRVTLLE